MSIERAFEDWWKVSDISEEEIKWEVFDGFKAGWQASRAALTVELPSNQCIDIHGYIPKDVVLYCRKAIEEAGVKVKP